MDAAVVRVRSVVWFATAVVLGMVCTLLVTQAWSVGAAPGDSDSTFVPTAGCRLADTRPAPRTVGLRAAPLGTGDIYEVTVRGSNGKCTGGLAIPSDAVAVALNVTAVNATASSNIRLYPANLTEVPLLSNLNVTAGAPATPNKVDVKLSPDGKIRVFNFNGSVNVILDVVGYYTNSTLKELAAGLAAANSKIAALETNSATNSSNIGTNATNITDVDAAIENQKFVNINTLKDADDREANVPYGGPLAFDASLVVPPDYTAGTDLTLVLNIFKLDFAPLVSCTVDSKSNYLYAQRPSTGATLTTSSFTGGGTITLDAVFRDIDTVEWTIAGPFEPGDSLTFGVFSPGSTCPVDDVGIHSAAVYYD